jgi:2-C-methyl-D-erythritol 2,4-cyclodiphosphate synthase
VVAFRIGIGYDVHRLVPQRPLRLGSVLIPSECGLLGHSDADVVLHALTDALLGACGAPDIGELFSDRDPAWKDADSRIFLGAALERLAAAGLRLANVDVVVHAQTPRLGPHKETIRCALAGLLDLAPNCVGVKATTNEGLDAIGRGEAIACWAAVLVHDQAPG